MKRSNKVKYIICGLALTYSCSMLADSLSVIDKKSLTRNGKSYNVSAYVDIDGSSPSGIDFTVDGTKIHLKSAYSAGVNQCNYQISILKDNSLVVDWSNDGCTSGILRKAAPIYQPTVHYKYADTVRVINTKSSAVEMFKCFQPGWCSLSAYAPSTAKGKSAWMQIR